MINIEGGRPVGPNMRRIIATLLLVSFLGLGQAYPNGIDHRGDDGCVCHGGLDESTTVKLTGLPEEYNSSQQYNITLTIESPVEMNAIQGSFRVDISHGSITGDGWQIIEPEDYPNGYTHTSDSNGRRIWEAVWTPPAEEDKLATFIVHGNAVNGDNETSGDEWNSQSLAVPGLEYTGDVSAPELASQSLSNVQKIIGAIAILSIVGLAIKAVRD